MALPKLLTQTWPGGIAPDTEGRVAALGIVGTLQIVGLQCARMMMRPDEVFSKPDQLTILDFLKFIASPLLFMVGFSLIAWGALLFVRLRRWRASLTVVIQLVMLLVLIIETVSQCYFFATGQTLDWPLFAYSVGRVGEAATVGGAAIQKEVWISLTASAALVAVGPWLTGIYARRKKANLAALAHVGKRAAGLCVVGFLLIVSGFLPSVALANDRSSPRDPILNLIATAFPRAHSGSVAAQQTFFKVAIERSPTAPATPRNVVYIILESTRADATTIYNPDLQTTPFLAELAKKSLVIDRMEAGIPATKKALRHVLCGFEASHSMALTSNTLGAMIDCLPNLLHNKGYRTFFLQSADESLDFRASSTYSMGFGEFIGPDHYNPEGFEKPNAVGWDDESMLAPSRALLSRYRKSTQPLFAAYLTVDPHYYCVPMTRRGHVQFDPRPGYDCYLNAVRDEDFFVHELIRQYEDLGLLKNTVFVIVADHGEAFGEHGRRTHFGIPWQEGLHVPAIIYDPNGVSPAPGHVTGNATQIDLAPTVAELLGFQVKSGAFQGKSLLKPLPADRMIHASCYGYDPCLMNLNGDLKFIDHEGQRPDELFDLVADPLEKHNLAADHPDLVKQRKAEVIQWNDDLAARYSWFEEHRDSAAATPAK